MSDDHYRWVVVAFTLLIQAFSLGILIYCFALFAVPWMDLFEAPRRDVMLAATLLQFGAGIFLWRSLRGRLEVPDVLLILMLVSVLARQFTIAGGTPRPRNQSTR